MTALYDTYFIVDWSAANAPKEGKDSIWIAEARRSNGRLRLKPLVNPPTRAEAVRYLRVAIARETEQTRRVFAGFDFPFGYPAGAAGKIAGAPRWDALWRTLETNVEDSADNRSNRFQLAARWNREIFDGAQFWGRPHQQRYRGLPAKKPTTNAFRALEYRIVERWRPPAKSVWQLAYNGAVGSQAMLGVARLETLRRTLGDSAAVWPFETQWASRRAAPVTIAEVYPSMFEPVFRKGDVKDAAQVRTVAGIVARADKKGALGAWLSKPQELSPADSAKVLREEGWIVGVGHIGTARPLHA